MRECRKTKGIYGRVEKNNKLLFVYQPTTTNYRHSAAFIEIAFSYWPTATKYKRLIDNMH